MKMVDVSSVITSLTQLVVPQPCFDEFFVKINFVNVPCLKVALSKFLGYGVILLSIFGKVPQILKIWRAASAHGISIISTSLELIALTGILVYSYARQFPFSAYGESIFLVLQTATIAFLVLTYSRSTANAVGYVTVYAAILAYLLSPAAPMNLLWGLQACVMPLNVAARILQAWTNFQNKSTGQLSAISILLKFSAGLARVFTSIQETGEPIVIVNHLFSSVCNGLLVFQIAYYWQSTAEQPRALTDDKSE